MTEENVALEEEAIVEDVEEPVDGFDTTDTIGEQTESAEAGIEELIARLNSVETKTSELDTIRHDVQSQLGRVQGIQSKVDKLSTDDASAIYRARIEQLEENLGSLQELILGSEFVDDQLKLTMREQQLDNRIRALESQPEEQSDSTDQSPEELMATEMWNEATSEVMRIAQDAGYDPANIPATIWSAGLQTGSPLRAVNHVSDWVREQVAETENVSKAAESKRAAKGGSPPRAGATSNIEDLVRSYGEGRDISTAEKQRVMQHLGIKA